MRRRSPRRHAMPSHIEPRDGKLFRFLFPGGHNKCSKWTALLWSKIPNSDLLAAISKQCRNKIIWKNCVVYSERECRRPSIKSGSVPHNSSLRGRDHNRSGIDFKIFGWSLSVSIQDDNRIIHHQHRCGDYKLCAFSGTSDFMVRSGFTQESSNGRSREKEFPIWGFVGGFFRFFPWSSAIHQNLSSRGRIFSTLLESVLQKARAAFDCNVEQFHILPCLASPGLAVSYLAEPFPAEKAPTDGKRYLRWPQPRSRTPREQIMVFLSSGNDRLLSNFLGIYFL